MKTLKQKIVETKEFNEIFITREQCKKAMDELDNVINKELCKK